MSKSEWFWVCVVAAYLFGQLLRCFGLLEIHLKREILIARQDIADLPGAVREHIDDLLTVFHDHLPDALRRDIAGFLANEERASELKDELKQELKDLRAQEMKEERLAAISKVVLAPLGVWWWFIA
jgi:hypothetical protein